MHFRVEVVQIGRVIAFQPLRPGGIGKVQKTDPAAGVGGNESMIIRRVLCQAARKVEQPGDQSGVEKHLLALGGNCAARIERSHHQAVKRLGRGLVVNAVAGDGVIEGIESTAPSRKVNAS